ncbi:hypothetical protein AMAG_01933 [Allomyces macrogynus ATCC 38327]|uniref:Uncharacterized protein n=1 Tax=Allomyces macrogynus (strain ATCC 38327) TaxID=578462 RepID=A0A0L0S133_ALLM3|nr:hypothetical protein AMAG_01933 [Allomyces macrogynus ATCC 38327]|eukprot:KNE56091.1 hypothetical protein AMAG_01933 [Allomyces macrogynus ATCC 38327]
MEREEDDGEEKKTDKSETLYLKDLITEPMGIKGKCARKDAAGKGAVDLLTFVEWACDQLRRFDVGQVEGIDRTGFDIMARDAVIVPAIEADARRCAWRALIRRSGGTLPRTFRAREMHWRTTSD